MPEIVNLEVHYISLVEAGANRREIIWKGADTDPEWTREVIIQKADGNKRLVYGIIYAPDEVDTQGDYTTAEEIERAAYGFMRGLRLHQVDRDHSFRQEAAYVGESWLIRTPDPLFPEEKAGAWAVGIKIEDDNLWDDVKAGKYKALSLAGYCERINTKKAKAPEGTPWNFRAADYSVEQLARACAWVKGVADPHRGLLPDDLTKGDCKLPHHTPDGKVVLRGVMAAGAAIQGARGGVDIPDADIDRVKRHLETHYHDFGRQAPWEAEKAETIFERFKKWWAGEVRKEGEGMTAEEVTKMVQEYLAPLTARLENLEKQEILTKAELEEALQPVKDGLQALEKAGPGSKQDKDPINPDDYIKLGYEIAKFANQKEG